MAADIFSKPARIVSDRNRDGQVTFAEIGEQADTLVPAALVLGLYRHLRLGEVGEDLSNMPEATLFELEGSRSAANLLP